MDDPGGVRALLAKLREQDAAEEPAAQTNTARSTQLRLRPWAAAPKRPAFLQGRPGGAYDPWQPTLGAPTPHASPSQKDRRTMPFADAFSLVQTRMRDDAVVTQLREVGRPVLTQMRQAQHALERTLAKERAAMIGAHGEQLHGSE